MKNTWFLLGLMLTFISPLFCQENTAKKDSLKRLVNIKTQPDSARIRHLLEYGIFLFDAGSDSAGWYADRAIELSKRTDNRYGAVRGLVLKALQKWKNQNMKDAQVLFSQAFAFAMKQDDYYLKELVANNMGGFFMGLGQLDSALKYQKMAVEFSGFLKDQDSYFKATSDLGKIHIYRGEYFEAAEKFFRARDYYLKNEQFEELIDTYINLGVLFLEINDTKNSLKNFKEALTLNKTAGNKEFEKFIYSNLGVLYLTVIKDYDSAKICLEKSLMLANQLPGAENTALVAMVNLSAIAIEQKQYPEALNYLNRIMESPLINLQFYERASALANFAKYHIQQGNLNLAEKYAEEDIVLAHEHKYLKLHEYIHRLLAQIAEMKNDYPKAHMHLTEAGILKDSLLNSDIDKKIIEATFDISLRQKEHENAILLKDNEIQEKEIRTQRVILTGIVVVLLLLVVLLLVISKNHKRLKHINDVLDENNRLLAESNLTKDKFFSIISHDLRNPFNAFLNLTQIMSDQFNNMSRDEIFEFNKVMSSSAKKLYVLLENLLEWSMMQRGAMPFNPELLNLKKSTFQTLEMAKDLAIMKGVNFEVSIPDEIELLADDKMLNTMIRNLTSNAVKFTPEQGKILVTAGKNHKSVEIVVQDTGIGMSPEIKDRLFVLDANTGRAGTSGEPSSGLGLILCQEFMFKHGGSIKVDSEVGTGTSLYLSFPFNHAEE